jgi:hypothetical protein
VSLFDPKDYQSITLHVAVKNITSGIEIVAPEPEGDAQNEKVGIQLLEFREKGVVVFGFPKNCCAVGHNLSLDLTIKDSSQKLSVAVTAKVLNVENDKGPFAAVTVQFVQYVQEDWEKFLEIYSVRQKEILVFFNSIKGEP